MENEYSYETLREKIEAAFTSVLKKYIPNETTEKEIEQDVYSILSDDFELNVGDIFYIKSEIGDINYLDISNILDDLTNTSIIEKCCRYNENKEVFLIVLIIRNNIKE